MVQIYGDTGGNPGTTGGYHDQSGSNTIADDAVNIFTDPANTTLAASTTYWVTTSNSATSRWHGV